ncbi:MAG: polyisoprenoid-binding protein [Burkholderiales bacterium]|nr:polyisoprenoid-binding protein [Burkholderiales bacterium]
MMHRPVFLALLGLGVPAIAADTRYTLDNSHTYPRWEASHFGFSTHRGQFNKTSGRLVLDPDAGSGSIEVTVETASVSTGDAKFDAHLKSADFFDTANHPAMTFKSNMMKFEGGKPVSATGDFTMLGVTRPVTLRIAQVKCAMHPIVKKEACGAEVTGTVRRSAHGMKFGIPGLSDDIKLTIQVEAIKD